MYLLRTVRQEEGGRDGDLSREEDVLYCDLFYHVHICQSGFLEACAFVWFEVIKVKAQRVQAG